MNSTQLDCKLDVAKKIKKIAKYQKEIPRKIIKIYNKYYFLFHEDKNKIMNRIMDALNINTDKFDIMKSEAIMKEVEKDKRTLFEQNFVNKENMMKFHSNRLSTLSPGFSGADLKNLCNEAAILAVREGHDYVSSKDFEEASERILGGLKKSEALEESVKEIITIHESGHAVAAWFLKDVSPLVKVTIVPRTKGVLGFAQYLTPDSKIIVKDQLKDQIKFILGGRIAEELFIGKVSTGAHDDLEKAFAIANDYVKKFAMTER